ncbi:unnamed protein product [Sphenostylis stenocarpa]|uniref:5'-3' exonuclease domain-containing protein n=1 Tax=Sphenostylis stenocarpa TaxID=92480 RepID=A0AA86VCF9_9FABA|nr:unnamed protein product [Sphenostylis stenocarpa]
MWRVHGNGEGVGKRTAAAAAIERMVWCGLRARYEGHSTTTAAATEWWEWTLRARKLPFLHHRTTRAFYHYLRPSTLHHSSRALLSKGYCTATEDSPGVLVSDAEYGTGQALQLGSAANVTNTDPLNGRVMIIDAKLHHGHLTHADGNGDWVLTIFTALSLIIDVLEFIPSHVVKRINLRFPAANLHFSGSLACKTTVKYNFNRENLLISGLPFGHTYNSSKESFTAKGQNFRHNLYPAYKSNRPPTPDTIVQGLQYLKASIKAMSIKVPGVEADDVIGTLALRSVDTGYKSADDIEVVRVVSPDKDFFQILSPSLRLLRIAPRGDQMVSFGVEDFANRYGGLKPSQFADMIALSGDRSDNIPGVNGIGDVHAVQLISRFGTLERLLESVDQIKEDRIRKVFLTDIILHVQALLRSDLPSYMVPFAVKDLSFTKPEDNGSRFNSLLTAISAYAEGFSADPLIRRAVHLWRKLEST